MAHRPKCKQAVLKLFLSITLCLACTTLVTGQSTEARKSENAVRGPFIRDVTTGYLLNCFFMSPRPYCWQGADCLLSAWEVDRSGGRVEFQPNCQYPSGFAFHSDWFKLVDASATAAVTLKHPIARQAKGQVTLEFRFKLQTRMDGACWQLRDLEQSGAGMAATATRPASWPRCIDHSNSLHRQPSIPLRQAV